jgi:hypothetical protein
MLENFGPDISEPQSARRPFEQADAELGLELGDAAADGRGRRAASEKLFASTTLAKIMSELRSAIVSFPGGLSQIQEIDFYFIPLIAQMA